MDKIAVYHFVCYNCINTHKQEGFMKGKDIHVFIAMLATFASMVTVGIMILMRYLG